MIWNTKPRNKKISDQVITNHSMDETTTPPVSPLETENLSPPPTKRNARSNPTSPRPTNATSRSRQKNPPPRTPLRNPDKVPQTTATRPKTRRRQPPKNTTPKKIPKSTKHSGTSNTKLN